MRKYFVMGLYLIILGAILLGGGVAMHAETTVLWNHGFKISKSVNKTEKLHKFNKIKVDSDAHSVNIETGDKYKIQIDGDELRNSDYYVSDGTLYITGNKFGKYKDIIGISSNNNPQITITVPSGSNLKELNLNMNQLYMNVNGLNIDKLKVSSGAYGSITFTDSVIKNAKNIDLESSYLEFVRSDVENFELNESNNSNITFSEGTIKNSIINTHNVDLDVDKGILDNLTFETDNGHADIKDSTLKGANNFKMKNGSFSADTVDVQGIDLLTVNGNVTYYGESKGKSYQNNPDSDDLLKVQTDNGSIKVNGK
ncbi:DUF4097 domain-containing protein [Companilactobacillus allii]|uniref:Uncharacterized protein n=1 Tax=Companilactobacillus allii TaxID=1847728 RepID=A0A1P8Q0A3_9LACO|nr:DUF4097 family beta strand repeat-containing protein [Companilactobacillus allii]APX71266.1 hypothetical protein BTM29_01285 [Companilactobacillus allii]USQ68348.1 DUF4097 domain-containing protein [Companilactobacillus allii]